MHNEPLIMIYIILLYINVGIVKAVREKLISTIISSWTHQLN